jgi:hypothetical protein
MHTSDHTEALARVQRDGVVLPPLRGVVPAAAWDPGLAGAIMQCGVEVEEEAILDLLLPDLDSVSPCG